MLAPAIEQAFLIVGKASKKEEEEEEEDYAICKYSKCVETSCLNTMKDPGSQQGLVLNPADESLTQEGPSIHISGVASLNHAT